jgi:hypothetical protein
MDTLARRIAARFASETEVAMEFPNQDALNDYLHEHPKADKSKHTVAVHPVGKANEAKDAEKKGDWESAAKHWNHAAYLWDEEGSYGAAASAMVARDNALKRKEKGTKGGEYWMNDKDRAKVDKLTKALEERAKTLKSQQAQHSEK